jgi:hypothetical protein
MSDTIDSIEQVIHREPSLDVLAVRSEKPKATNESDGRTKTVGFDKP